MARMKHLLLSSLALGIFLSGCQKEAPLTGTFDVPAIINEDFASATLLLGKPSESEIANDEKGAARVATWDTPKGETLLIFYDSVSKKPASIIFTIADKEASPDKMKVLNAGKLTLDDARYSLKFTQIDNDNKKIVGVIVKPLKLTGS